MSIPRLTFLYPHLFKSLRVHHTRLVSQPLRVGPNHLSKAAFSTTSPPTQEAYPQRYGTAAEPQPPPSGTPVPENPRNDKSLAGAIEQEVNAPNKQEEKKQIKAPPKKDPDKTASDPKDEADKSRDGEIDATLRDPSQRATELDASESTPKDAAEAAEAAETARRTKPLETVLQMGPPTTDKAEDHKAPHLQAPPYVHHFDTFSLVKDLEGGGFSEDQSVTIMKAIRGLLALNLDVAKEGLVSKSDVENVRCSPFPPPSNPTQTPTLTPITTTGNLSLPRRLFRTPHRNPQHPKILLHQNPHPTLPPPTHLRHPLPAHHAGNPSPQRRPQRHAQRPPHGRPHAAAIPRQRDLRIKLQNQRGIE